MEANDHIQDLKGGMMTKKDKVVTLPPKRDKDISREPEFRELLDIMESGKVSTGRTMAYLEDEIEKVPKPGWKQKMEMQSSRLTLRLSPQIHERLKLISQAEKKSINDLLNVILEKYTRREIARLQKTGEGKES